MKNNIFKRLETGIKKSFTLIELITVIIVLGILAAIVVPNISSLKEDAIPVAVSTNEGALQTAVDMYALDHNGLLPTVIVPTIEDPQPLNYDILYPDYLKSKPEIGNYLVDSFGKVWGSTADAPNQVHYTNGAFTFKTVDEAEGYELMEYGETKEVDAKAARGKYRLKDFASLPIEGEKLADIYTVENPENKSLLVSSVDKYGLQTAPVGEKYLGNQEGLPINAIGAFYLITDANGAAVWDGLQTVELLPEGTSITYSFATSNDNRTYSAFTTDIGTLSTSRYMKVKVEMASVNDKMPTLKLLKVIFHLVGEDVTSYKPTTPIALAPNETAKSFTEVLNFGEKKKIGSFEFVGKEKATVVYRSSEDGSIYSPPTFFPEELPDGQYVKMEIQLKRPSSSVGNTGSGDSKVGNPTVEEIIVNHTVSERPKTGTVVTPPPKAPVAPSAEWETVTSLSIIEDATEIGDWVSVSTTESEPAGTRMLYILSTSNNETSWSEPVEYTSSINMINEMANSRFLKVQILYQRNPGVTKMPALETITIDYKLLDGTLKSKLYDGNGNPTDKEGRLANGSFIEFGKYNGKPLYWNVVKEVNGKTMLFMTPESQLPNYDFDVTVNEGEPSDSGRVSYGSNNWATSDVRMWLNNTFYNEAFTNKSIIANVTHNHVIGEIDKGIATSGSEPHAFKETSVLIKNVLMNYDKSYKHTVTDKVFFIGIKELVEDVHPVVAITNKEYILRDAIGTSSTALPLVKNGNVERHGNPGYVRPAISLNSTDLFQYGDGSKDNPYRINAVKMGGVVSYGTYNGHALKWNVVEQKGNQVTLFMTEPLKNTDSTFQNMPFSLPDASSTNYYVSSSGSGDWEQSGLRSWLNGDFYTNAFANKTPITPIAHNYILPKIDIAKATSGSQYHTYQSGTSTTVSNAVTNYQVAYKRMVTDKVFLVSIEEIANSVYPAIGSDYYGYYAKGDYYYWTRDANGNSDASIRRVHKSGGIDMSAANSSIDAVRPAITIDASHLVDPTKKAGTPANPYTVN